MKNILTVTALLFLVSITSQAQFSIRGGLNFSTLDFSEGLDNFEEENKSGYHLGLHYAIGLTSSSSLRVGGLLSTKGTKLEATTSSLNYLEVPVSFLYHIGKKRSGLFLEAGVYGGSLLNSDEDKFGVDIKNLDLGLNFGAGVNIGSLGGGITYGYGVANIIDGEMVNIPEAYMRNRNLSIYLTLSI